MTEDELIKWEERKSICMIDGELSEEEAEKIATKEIEEWKGKENDISRTMQKIHNNL